MENFAIQELNAYTAPVITESVTDDFVAYGADNNYFQFLIDRYNGSTTNNAILTGLVRNIYGKGLESVDKEENNEQYLAMLRIIAPSALIRFIQDRMILGMGALQVVKKAGKVTKVSHFPMETLRAGKADKKGNVKTYLYHPNWQDYKKSDTLQKIPTFEYSKNTGTSVYILKTYTPGNFYYSPVDYQGALPYALLEEEISNYLLNDTLNGFSGTKIVNFNNGEPDPEKRREIVSKTMKQLTGTTGQKVLVSFNKDKESAVSVDDISLNDAPAHYQYLSDECFRKLIVGHRITSPTLLGVRDGNSGFGSNADEIKNATLLLDSYVIDSYREEILQVLQEILVVNGIVLDLYFISLTPLEFIDTEKIQEIGDEDDMEKETGIEQEEELSMIAKLTSFFKKTDI